MKKSISLVLLLPLLIVKAFGMEGDTTKTPTALSPSKYPDLPYTKENAVNRKYVPYTTLREADVMWSKRVWRVIDLREKMNLPL